MREEDIRCFREEIKPYWAGKSLEDVLRARYGGELDQIAKVVKINQKDHAQGHICPDCARWLKMGPAALREEALEHLKTADGQGPETDFYRSVALVMEGAMAFMDRYHDLMEKLAGQEQDPKLQESMRSVAENCRNLSKRPAETFHEAVQSIWFLFVILHMESNASSFSPGRMDSYLAPYYNRDIEAGTLDREKALEIIECLWLKFNQIVYLRNANSAKFFAGFPIGFNIVTGGQDENGNDFVNDLSFLF